ncbi:adenylate kinase [Leptospirillum ferriphilum]|jgi:adenylate kinase|uniref:Adenylate kinase n=2 Tax=Leptospirillum TaxID=179 RepID=A0A2I2MH68_9BACT|nr:adenylate kinase [Leptospirillum ferriphilum]EDZ39177.1 MAG: Adenylate kinase [Leptospirillum sp. Group II '5-way CG']
MFKSVVVFIGPPGVGKGTQASLLADSFSIPKFATGDLLREALKNKTPLGVEAKNYMDSGKLVPDQLVLNLIKGKISALDKETGFILDGFPRTLSQAQGLDEILLTLCHNVSLAIEFSMDEEERIARLTGRRLCPNCQRTYHILFAPPKKDSLCDYCSVQLVQRADDNEEVIRKRSAVYWETTEPLLNYYRQKNILKVVDASSSIENVFSRIKHIFQELN